MLINEFLLLARRCSASASTGSSPGHQHHGADVDRLILTSVNINLLAFSLRNGDVNGQVFALYIIAVAAAEVGVGLALVLLIYRNRRSISLDELSEMKG
jgi:hypothetical protein